jgi:hypothetical protein
MNIIEIRLKRLLAIQIIEVVLLVYTLIVI